MAHSVSEKVAKWLLWVAVMPTLSGCAHTSSHSTPAPGGKATRSQLSIGYSLLYQEADGIPKLGWLLMFKRKTEETAQVLDDLVSFYKQLGDSLSSLSKEYPAVHLDVVTMSDIEGDVRKAIGEDTAKDFVPMVGKSGPEFEREALLLFLNALNEQRHLAGVMLERETVPGLKKFLEKTKAQLDAHYERVDALLKRRYFAR